MILRLLSRVHPKVADDLPCRLDNTRTKPARAHAKLVQAACTPTHAGPLPALAAELVSIESTRTLWHHALVEAIALQAAGGTCVDTQTLLDTLN
jgi:hypothetical protein